MSHPILTWTKHHSFSIILIFLSLTAPHLHAALTVEELSDSITIHLGDGSNVSYLAFAESSLGSKPVIYAWHYNDLTNSDGPPRTGTDLLDAVISETAGTTWALSYTVDDFGLTTSYSIGSVTSTQVDPLSSPVWTYWIQGGSEFVEYGDVESFTFSIGSSLIVSPAYSDTRYISNGSYDVWTITPFSYGSAASDTHDYTDTSGKIQSVTFGTYEGSAPVLKKPPTVFSSKIVQGSQLEIVFSVVQGGVYQLQQQEGLTQNGWQNFEPSFIAPTAQKTYTLPMDNSSKKGFFRLIRKE